MAFVIAPRSPRVITIVPFAGGCACTCVCVCRRAPHAPSPAATTRAGPHGWPIVQSTPSELKLSKPAVHASPRSTSCPAFSALARPSKPSPRLVRPLPGFSSPTLVYPALTVVYMVSCVAQASQRFLRSRRRPQARPSESVMVPPRPLRHAPATTTPPPPPPRATRAVRCSLRLRPSRRRRRLSPRRSFALRAPPRSPPPWRAASSGGSKGAAAPISWPPSRRSPAEPRGGARSSRARYTTRPRGDVAISYKTNMSTTYNHATATATAWRLVPSVRQGPPAAS